MHRPALTFVLSSLVAACVSTSPGVAAAAADRAGIALFEAKIRPVLVQHCYACHSVEARTAKKLRGGLLLDTRQGLLAGGDSGPALVPGKPAESLLLQTLRYTGDVRMPPRQQLPESVLADFERWIRLGAADPRDGSAAALASGLSLEEGRRFWAYRPLAPVAIPAVQGHAWVHNDVDAFIVARLEAANLTPAAEADRATLIRRLSFDLLGLPPTPEQVDRFVRDRRADACERLIEAFLASPHFGERWGRHWLDIARYAESLTLRGFVLEEAWRYRDHVIDRFSADVPFDRFVREQIAGDLLPAATIADRRRQLIATTFLTLGNTNLEEQDKQQLRMDVVDEQLDTIGRGLLGQTLGCARCHDHKFDPIPTRDYYALAGILRNTRTMTHANVSRWLELPLPEEPQRERLLAAHERQVAELDRQIRPLKATVSKGKLAVGDPPAARLRQLEQERKRLIDSGPRRDRVMAVVEEPTIEDARVHVRGSPHQLGERVPRGFLQVTRHDPPRPLPADQSGRRELADWLASADNPLTARVFVNRVWHWLFGAGLVRTTDNFGSTGELPSHPELLDHLTRRFIADGWSVKRLVRHIVRSRTYRQSSLRDARAVAADPENRLLAAFNRRRLDAECLRDTMLLVSGQLTFDRGGPTFPASLAADYAYRHTDTRRSVYAPVFRNTLPELFEVFDFADPSVATGRRTVSTVVPQALFLMNHPFVIEQARHAARRLLATGEADTAGRIALACRWTLGRPPGDGERRLLLSYLGQPGEAPAEEAWTRLFQVLFASIDFRYVY